MSGSPDDTNPWSLADLATPWCVHVAATLRIADHVAAGITQIDELASAAGADAESLHRMLRHLVERGVFEEPEPGRFRLNAAAEMLREGHPSGLRLGLDLGGIGGRMAHAWSSLLSAVRTGRPAYHEVWGRSYWEDLDAHPEVAASFDALMGQAGHGIPDPEVLVASDWTAVQTVVDVGGGTGALLAEILRAHPGVRGTLVDLPRTVERSHDVFEAAGVADRVSAVGQSFFDPLPAGADLYVLSRVLNDWPAHQQAEILRRCADAARPSGRVAVLGGVSESADGGGPSPNLLMLVLVGGGDHTVAEFGELARGAGLEVVGTGHQPTGRLVVELKPT